MEIEKLFEIDKKIRKIEDKDDNYESNPKWIELRKEQNELFKQQAECKVKYHTEQFERTNNEYHLKQIKRYKEYLENYGNYSEIERI